MFVSRIRGVLFRWRPLRTAVTHSEYSYRVCVCVCVCVCRILWDLETLTIERPKHELGYVATGGGGINSTYVAHAETDPYSSGLKNTL